MPTFRDLALAAYRPRKLYYARREDGTPPPGVAARREIAFRYRILLDDPSALDKAPIAVPPAEWRQAVRTAQRLDCWPAVTAPIERDVRVEGRDCRGIVHKIVDVTGDHLPSVVSAGSPPDRGIWEADSVRAVAAAKALAWERERAIERAIVEYPAAGIIRSIRLGTRRKAAYKRALRAVRSMDGPPPRLRDDARCGACEYRETCGVRTRSLRSLLG